MKLIANIVSDKPNTFDKRISVVDSFNKIENELPTLIINRNKVLQLFPKEFKVLDKHIKDKIYWTYSLQEDRSKSEIETERFIINSYKDSIKEIKYFFIDPIKYRLNSIKKIVDKIQHLKEPIAYNHLNKVIYIYSEGFIFGIDLNLFELFFEIKKENIISKVSNLCKGKFYGEELSKKYSDYLERINNDFKYLPYIEFIDN